MLCPRSPSPLGSDFARLQAILCPMECVHVTKKHPIYVGAPGMNRYVGHMTNIDQFESVFKAASKPQYDFEPVAIQRVLIITDQAQETADVYCHHIKAFLRALDDLEFSTITGDQFSSVPDLLGLIEEHKPDLVCTHRNLHMPASDYPFSIGVFVEVLTQATSTPVLLFPHPSNTSEEAQRHVRTKTVMAITDHLTGDHHLVSYAANFTEPDGQLLLSHVEDQEVFERYMEAIGKIASIDTDAARASIMERLLQDPTDYVDSCRTVLSQHGLPLQIETLVQLGHHLIDYKRLIEKHDVDLLVLNTKDDDQLAMHGLAYPLSVELRNTPMLLL